MRSFIRCLALLLLAGPLFCSCRPKDPDGYLYPKFGKTFSGEFDIVAPLDYRLVRSIFTYKDYIGLICTDGVNPFVLHLVDKKTGEIVADAVTEGRGPGEMLMPSQVSVDGNLCYLFDGMSLETQVYDLDRILQGEYGYCWTRMKEDLPWPPTDVRWSSERELIFSNRSPVQKDSTRVPSRIVLDVDGRRYSYDEYPVPDPSRNWVMFTQPSLTVSPDFTKLAVAPGTGGILEMFDLLDDGIRLRGIGRYLEPDFPIKNNWYDFSGGDLVLPYFFSDLASSDGRIYCGMEAEERQGKRPGFPYLAVFDWDGRPLLRVKNSLRIENVAYDVSEDAVYAVLGDAEQSLFVGKMDMKPFFE